jgi:hypothetical protein
VTQVGYLDKKGSNPKGATGLKKIYCPKVFSLVKKELFVKEYCPKSITAFWLKVGKFIMTVCGKSVQPREK